MMEPIWNIVATKMANTLCKACPGHPQGVILVHHADQDHLIIWLYNCECTGPGELVSCELRMLRQRLKENGVEELGFGLSQDSRAWTLVGRANQQSLRTQAGKAFFREMLAEKLGEALQQVLLTAYTVCAQELENALATKS